MQGTTKFLTLCGLTLLCAAALGLAPASRALPGDLPKPVDQLTAGELYAFGAALQFDNGPVQNRDCQRGACLGRIDAVRNQIPGPANVSVNGTLVARLVNLGAQGGADAGPENRYGTARVAQREFYIIAIRDSVGAGWSWSVREAVRGDGGLTVATRSGLWTVCRHDANIAGHPKGRSEFASCASSAGGAGGAGGAGADDLTRLSGPAVALSPQTSLRFPPNDPGWLSCSDGCCTAGL